MFTFGVCHNILASVFDLCYNGLLPDRYQQFNFFCEIYFFPHSISINLQRSISLTIQNFTVKLHYKFNGTTMNLYEVSFLIQHTLWHFSFKFSSVFFQHFSQCSTGYFQQPFPFQSEQFTAAAKQHDMKIQTISA